jgi:hypothetical protein
MPQPALVSLIGWPLFIALIAGLIAWVWWRHEKPLREFRQKNAHLDETLRRVKATNQSKNKGLS